MGIILTSDGDYGGQVLSSAVILWDILHSSEFMQREIAKLSQQMHLETWINPFLIDVAMYKGLHHEILRFSTESSSLVTKLRLTSAYYCLKDYAVFI